MPFALFDTELNPSLSGIISELRNNYYGLLWWHEKC